MQPVFFIIEYGELGGSLLRFGRFGDIADAIQYNTGAVGVGVQRFAGGNAGKHQYGGHAAFQTGDHIGIHASPTMTASAEWHCSMRRPVRIIRGLGLPQK